jgi:lipopolysaccharide biosynthesis glycosyltransferase
MVTACDENYVRGVAACIRSAIDTLPSGRAAKVYVLDGGLTEASKAKLHVAWQAPNISIEFVQPDLDAIRDMPVSEHINLCTYLRLLVAELLPPDVSQAIYLDADTIVVRNLEELWATPLDVQYCAAAQDAFVPVLDPERTFSHPIHSMTLPDENPLPIPNYQELNLDPSAPYFNAGVMLVNVERWRKENVARRAIQVLRDNAGKVRYWDQYALNIVCYGEWKMLDPRWNHAHIHRIPSHELSHYSQAEFDTIRTDPWIVHFDFKPKPWDVDCEHPFRKLFFASLDRTPWRGFRPRRPLKERAEIAIQKAQDAYEGYRQWRKEHFAPLIRSYKCRLFGRDRFVARANDAVHVVSAADDNYAMPLAVTIRSAIDRLPPDRPLAVHILDGGLSDETKERLLRSWQSPLVSVEWLQPPIDKIADLKTENHLNLVTYLRLFMPSLLPAELERVIFLDADLLIQRNLWRLWMTPIGDAPIGAVNDYFTPYLNTRQTIGRPSICDRHPDKCLPIENYRELGLKPTAGYFNAGVMLVNLKKWREMDVFGQAVRLVREHHEHVRYCDQYALNVLFSGKWLPLDPRWNQNSNLWAWGGEQDGAFDPALYRRLKNDPWIIHFTWTRKPWHFGCTHPATRKFFQVVDRTDWRSWRPPAPPRTLGDRVGDVYKQYRAWYRRAISPKARALKVAVGLRKAA